MILYFFWYQKAPKSRNTGIKDYILIGGLTKFFECRQIIEDFKSLWDVKITIPEYSDYATAIGAVIAPDAEKEEIWEIKK